MDPVPASDSTQRRMRIAIISVSCVFAVAGAFVLATHDSGGHATTEGVSATLQVPSHPGWLVAGSDALWLALNRDRQSPVVDKPLIRLDLATGVIEQTVSVGGEASYLTRVGNRLIASVQHLGQDEFGGRHLLAFDWLSGRPLVRRGFDGPVDRLVLSGKALWALEARPGRLLRLDPRTLAPTAAPLQLSPGRTLGLAAGAGYIWATAADAGEVLRIDPVTRAIRRVDVGGYPMGILVAGGSVWYADHKKGEVSRLDTQTLRSLGEPIRVGPGPSWLAAAGGSLFVADASDGTITRIELRSAQETGTPIRITPPAETATLTVAPTASAVWVGSFASNTVTRVNAGPSQTPSRTVVVSGDELVGGTSPMPRGGKVIASIAAPSGGAFTVGEGAVWTMNGPDSTLTRIDPSTNSVAKRIQLIGAGEDAATGGGAVWVSHPAENTVSRIDPSTNAVTATIRVGPQPAGVAFSHGSVWIANIGGPSVSRIDPATNRVVATIRVGPTRACCAEHMDVAGGDAVWAAVPNFNALVRIDPATNSIASSVKVPYLPCAFLAVDEDDVWSTTGGCGRIVARIDARARRLTTVLEGQHFPVGLAVEFGSVWVAVVRVGTVDRVDPNTARVVSRLPVGGLPVRLEAGFGSVWVSDDEGLRVLRIEPLD